MADASSQPATSQPVGRAPFLILFDATWPNAGIAKPDTTKLGYVPAAWLAAQWTNPSTAFATPPGKIVPIDPNDAPRAAWNAAAGGNWTAISPTHDWQMTIHLTGKELIVFDVERSCDDAQLDHAVAYFRSFRRRAPHVRIGFYPYTGMFDNPLEHLRSSGEAGMMQRFAKFGELTALCDFLAPDFYPRKPRTFEADLESIRNIVPAMRRGAPGKPIYPFIRGEYAMAEDTPGARLTEQDATRYFTTVLETGVDGMILWSEAAEYAPTRRYELYAKLAGVKA